MRQVVDSRRVAAILIAMVIKFEFCPRGQSRVLSTIGTTSPSASYVYLKPGGLSQTDLA